MLTLEQLKARKSGLGGSDIAAICGISPWATPNDIYFDKINPHVSEKKATPAQLRGSVKEAEIVATYAQVTGNSISLEKELLRHPEYDFAIASLDAWVNNKEFILECKTAHWAKAHEWGQEGTDQIPDYYLPQVAWYAFVCNKPRVDIALLLGDDEKNQFKIYTYLRNPKLEQNLFKVAQNFWVNHVLAKIPPKAIGVKQAEKEIVETVELLAEIKAQINLLEKQSEELRYNIQNFMGESAVIVDEFNNLLVTWKPIESKEKFDEAKFKADYPELYQQYIALTKPSRRFEIKAKSEAKNV